VPEDAGATGVLATVSRPSDQSDNALVISLLSSDSSVVKTPGSVSIPAGQDSVSVFLEAVDDELLTGDRTVTISAFASGFQHDTKDLVIEDRESLLLAIDRSFILETGLSSDAFVTVIRGNTNIENNLVVDLTISPSDQAQAPVQVTIPAGASSATFQLSGVDDAVSDDPATVTVTGEAEGYDSTSDTVDVIDATRLRVTASTTSTTENAGDDAIQLTIERFGEDISGELVVSLASSDEGAIETPQTVTIPAGERDVVAMLDVKDDALLDGTQSAEITVSATGYEDSQVTIEVLDHESLSIEIAAETVKESDGEGATTAVVTRSNSDTTELLRVSILNSDASEVVAPPIVEIPAGAQSVTFVIDAVNDLIVDGLQQVALTVMATGYVDGQDLLGVIDSGPGTWTNPIHAFDIDANGFINVADAMVLVLNLRTGGPRVLPPPSPGDSPPPWLDPNRDGNFNFRDPFFVINFLNEYGSMPTANAPDAEGEDDGGGNAGGGNAGGEGESGGVGMQTSPTGVSGASLQQVGQFGSTASTGVASQSNLTQSVIAPVPIQTVADDQASDRQLDSQTIEIQNRLDVDESPSVLLDLDDDPLSTPSSDAYAELGSSESDDSNPLTEILDEFADDVDDAFRGFDND